LGVAVFTLVADKTQNVSSLPFIINGIAHGLAVYGKAFVVVGIGLIPVLQGSVKMDGIDPDQDIADNVFAGDTVLAVVIAAPEPPPGILAKAFGPIGDCPVSAHPTQAGPGGNSQDGGESMPSPLRATRIGDIGEKGRERLHLVSIQHHFGTSGTIE